MIMALTALKTEKKKKVAKLGRKAKSGKVGQHKRFQVSRHDLHPSLAMTFLDKIMAVAISKKGFHFQSLGTTKSFGVMAWLF